MILYIIIHINTHTNAVALTPHSEHSETNCDINVAHADCSYDNLLQS